MQKKSLKISCYLAALVAFFVQTNTAFAQFTDVSGLIGQHYTTQGSPNGNGISFYDFNKDGWDDLSISMGSDPPLFYENQEGNFTLANFEIPHSGIGNIMMLMWADYDNDNDEDLLITKRQGPIELWNNDGAFNFSNVAESAGFLSGNYTHEGAAFADFNHDGCLDLYISKLYYCANINGEQFENKLYQSNCDGTFTDVTLDSGLSLCPQGTFQAVFIDYNKDGWEDLYLINELEEHTNYLFENNGDSTFQDASESSGLGIEIDAMTGTVGDFNNDLLLDIFVTNRPNSGGNYIMVSQSDGTYVNQASELGLGLDFQSWGAVWLDENNDSWEDLFVTIPFTGSSDVLGNEFYINNEGVSFSEGRNQLGFDNDFSRAFVCAKGDINGDGYFDLAVSSLFTDPFQLYQNTTGSNHYLSLSFEGTYSNRNGVGTWIHCYAQGQQWARYTLSGENLIGQNSGKQIFGLGDIEIIDSLVVDWNRGTHEVYYNLTVNQHMHLIEGQSFSFEIEYSDDLYLCEGDSMLLSAGDFESYLWSTGDTARVISVSSPGQYFVTVSNENGFSIDSYTLEISDAPLNELDITISPISCFGANDGAIDVSISNSPADAFTWNTSSPSFTIEDLEQGVYSFTGLDSYGCPFSGDTLLEEPLLLTNGVQIINPSCFELEDGSIVLDISGGTEPYLINWNGVDSYALPEGDFSITITDFNDCLLQMEVSLNAPEPLEATIQTTNVLDEFTLGTASLDISGGTPPYGIQWSNGVIDELMLNDLASGDYNVSVLDASGCPFNIAFSISTAVGISENANSILAVYPNPFYDELHFVGCDNESINWTLYNAMGEIISSGQSHPCSRVLDFKTISKGFYLLSIDSAVPVFIKLVKLHH